MDTFCIERGTLLDAPSIITLEEPNKHSVHCLVDVPVCRESPYEILMDPEDGTSLYTRGYRVSDNMLFIDLARSVGSCTTCTGEGNLAEGFRAEVTGTVIEARNGDIPPVIDVTGVKRLLEGESSCNDAFITDAAEEDTTDVSVVVEAQEPQ